MSLFKISIHICISWLKNLVKLEEPWKTLTFLSVKKKEIMGMLFETSNFIYLKPVDSVL